MTAMRVGCVIPLRASADKCRSAGALDDQPNVFWAPSRRQRDRLQSARTRHSPRRRHCDPRPLIFLEKPYTENHGPFSTRRVVLAGLESQMEYWIDLAVGWLEQGVPLDEEIVEALSREYEIFPIVRRWNRAVMLTLLDTYAKVNYGVLPDCVLEAFRIQNPLAVPSTR